MIRRILKGVLAVTFLLALAGCAGLRMYQAIDSSILSGNYAQGVETVEKSANDYGQSALLLYYLDKGTLLQLQGDYAKSNAALENADHLIDQLYTKSVSGELGALLTNDLTLAYEGEDFEQVMVNVMKCLNYLYLNQWNDAQVEARKVNERLGLLSAKYGKEAVYSEDALARYLSAFAYEAGGDLNDAFIDYKNCYKAYDKYQSLFATARPDFLREDIWRAGLALGIDDQVKQYLGDMDTSHFVSAKERSQKAQVLFVVYDGMAPYKISRATGAWIKDKYGKPYLLTVAFPLFVKRPYHVDNAEVLQADTLLGQSRMMEDITTIGARNLEQRIGFIKLKAIARATVKYLAAQTVQEKTHTDNPFLNGLISVATNAFAVGSEQADTRSWRVLPARFHLVRVLLTPGQAQLTVRVHMTGGESRDIPFRFDSLKAGDLRVVPVYEFN